MTRTSDEPKSADYLKLVTVLPGILLVVGLARLWTFYDMFNVPIFQFISFSEVIGLILPDLIWVITILLIAGADSYAEFLLVILFNKQVGKRTDIVAPPRDPYPSRILVWLWVVLLIVGSLAYFFLPGRFQQTIALRFTVILAVGLFVYLFIMERVSSNSRFFIHYYKYFVLIGLVLMALLMKSSYVASSMRYNTHYHPTPLTITFSNGQTFQNSDSVFVIGRVDRYSFVFDKQRQETLVLNNSDMKSVLFTSQSGRH